jgi:hypothetical protein
MNAGTQITVPPVGDPPPISITMLWAPPLGTFVWQPKSTLYEVLVISGGDPSYAVSGYEVEWHCYSETWSRSNATVVLGRDQLNYNGTNIPMSPGAISKSFVLNGALPDTTHPAPAGTCINGQNAW